MAFYLRGNSMLIYLLQRFLFLLPVLLGLSFGHLLGGTVIVESVFAPCLAPHDPLAVDLGQSRLLPSSTVCPLGTDHLGRCVLSRLIWGTRVSLSISFLVLLTIMGISIPYGMLAGWCGGRVDNLLMRLVDVLLAFPRLIFALVIAGMLGPGLTNVMLARIDMGWLILGISGLSFLGLGAQPPTPEWGTMLNDSRPYFQVAPNLMLYPGLAIMLAVLDFNLPGDGLRDVLDPRGFTRRR